MVSSVSIVSCGNVSSGRPYHKGCADMSYESDCDDYAVFGNPERDAMDYEFNAQYDRFDGWDCVDPNDDPGCPVCGYNATCAECVEAAAHAERIGREAYEASLVRSDCDDAPF